MDRFIFNPRAGETAPSQNYSDARRCIAEAYYGAASPPQNVGEGIASIGQALAARSARIGAFPAASGATRFDTMGQGIRNVFGFNFPGKGGLY